MGKAPSAPNPVATANAQTASNRETAITQSGLNMVNQTTPQGNLTYKQIGTWADGTPRYEATQSLTPQGQQIFQTGQQTQQNLANLAQEQSGRLSGLLSQPFNLSNEATEARLMELGRSRLDPLLAQRRQSAETDLVNRGIRPGSTAYDRAIGNVNQSETDAYNQLLLQGRGQAVQEALMQRTQPLNEILALAGQGQVQTPQYVSTPQTGVAGTDVAGLTQNAYNTASQGYNSMMGGLFSAGAGLLAAPSSSVLGGLFALSDRRAKTDIKRIGQTDSGVPIYKFRYKTGGPVQIGYMAQDLLETHPHAVVMGPDNLYRVNYDEVA